MDWLEFFFWGGGGVDWFCQRQNLKPIALKRYDTVKQWPWYLFPTYCCKPRIIKPISLIKQKLCWYDIVRTSSSASLFLTDAKLELISSDKTPCGKSSVNYNVTLAKGAKAGTYYKMATVDKMDDCIGHCCGSKRCDVAFMVNKNCYLVKCHNSDSCELKRSENSKFDTMLSMVSKTKGKTIQGKRQYVQHITSGTSLFSSFYWPIIWSSGGFAIHVFLIMIVTTQDQLTWS